MVHLRQESKASTFPSASFELAFDSASPWLALPTKEGSGFVAVRTKKFIVYGSYSIAMLPSVCVEVTESLGERAMKSIRAPGIG